MAGERIEYTTLEPVPAHHRDIGFMDMLATWIAANANNGTWYIGGVVAAAAFGGAVLVTVIANPIAYLVMALVGYMGFKVGTGTMSLTRPAFGVRGCYLPSILNATQFIGWTAVNTFIAVISFSFIMAKIFGFPSYGQPGSKWVLILGIVILSIAQLLSISLGHHSVKIVERIGVVLLLILGIWETVMVIRHVPLQQIISWRPPIDKALPLGSAMDAMVAFSFGWVPAICEFTRYTKDKVSSTVAPMIGANVSLFWFAGIGIISAIGAAVLTGEFNSDPSTIAAKLGLGLLPLAVIVLTCITANAVNLMAAGMSISNIFPKLKAKHALWLVAIVSALVTMIPVFLTSFMDAFILFLDYIGMVFAPIFAIMIVDFYLVKRCKYYAEDLDKKDGKYWFTNGINWMTMSAWIIGVVIYFLFKQIAFFSDGIGVTYPSMIVVALVYWFVAKGSVTKNTGKVDANKTT